MSKRFFEGAQHAARYALTRPSYPPELMQKIIGFLGIKVLVVKIHSVLNIDFFVLFLISIKGYVIMLLILVVVVDKVLNFYHLIFKKFMVILLLLLRILL